MPNATREPDTPEFRPSPPRDVLDAQLRAIRSMQKAQLVTPVSVMASLRRDVLAGVDSVPSSLISGRLAELSASMRTGNAFAASSAITEAIRSMQKAPLPALALADVQGALLVHPDAAVPSGQDVLSWRRDLSPADRRRFDDDLRELLLYLLALALGVALAVKSPHSPEILGTVLGGVWVAHRTMVMCSTALEIIERGKEPRGLLPSSREERRGG